jgi:phosphate/sulfate permease
LDAIVLAGTLVTTSGFATSPTPFIALMMGGFAIGIFGYLYGSRFIVAIGVAMIFLATLVIPLLVNISN